MMQLSIIPGMNIGNKQAVYADSVEGVRGTTARAILSLSVPSLPVEGTKGETLIKNENEEAPKNLVQTPEVAQTIDKKTLDNTPAKKSGRDGNKPAEISNSLWYLLQTGKLAKGTIGHPVGKRIKGRKGSGGKGFGIKS